MPIPLMHHRVMDLLGFIRILVNYAWASSDLPHPCEFYGMLQQYLPCVNIFNYELVSQKCLNEVGVLLSPFLTPLWHLIPIVFDPKQCHLGLFLRPVVVDETEFDFLTGSMEPIVKVLSPAIRSDVAVHRQGGVDHGTVGAPFQAGRLAFVQGQVVVPFAVAVAVGGPIGKDGGRSPPLQRAELPAVGFEPDRTLDGRGASLGIDQ
mmetsp:Transcript_58/g.127  ORF Transcript_58/g.127 Transcript_58/m.127 type:complete len:206 (+) Transcript_58:287-904(+)